MISLFVENVPFKYYAILGTYLIMSGDVLSGELGGWTIHSKSILFFVLSLVI